MKLTVLGGSAAAPNPGDACAGYHVASGATALLLDCGSGVVSQLRALADERALSGVVVSHLHADHTLDLVTLRYALKYVPAGRGRIEVTSGVDDGFATLSVRDNGIGIPLAYQRNIFDVFGRVPDAEQVVDGAAVAGSGVGLAIVKRVAEAHRGSVGVESAPGRGSCFTLRLPGEEGIA